MDGLVAALEQGSDEARGVIELRESMRGELGVEGLLGDAGGVWEDERGPVKGWEAVGRWGAVVGGLMRKYGVQRGIAEEEGRRH